MEKAIIYLRTSTKDQHPELQEPQVLKFCTEMGLEAVEVVHEKGSAYKLEKTRPKWEYTVKRAKNEKLHIVLWRYDRSFRNREEFYKFMKVIFEVYGKKVYSVKEPHILSFWKMIEKSHTEDPVFNEFLKNIFKAIWNLMIQQAGEQAEEESRKKSDRVKLAVRKTCPQCKKENLRENNVCEKCGADLTSVKTKSYKGKKWGRKAIKVDTKIIAAYKMGKTYRQIAEEVYYWGKSNHKKYVSVGYVGNVLKGVDRN